MDRREAVRGLKNETQTRDIPIIGMAAHALDSEREQAIATGCDEFDVKPIEFESLLAIIRRVVANPIHPSARACAHKIAICESDLINVRFFSICGLKWGISRGPRNAMNRYIQRSKIYKPDIKRRRRSATEAAVNIIPTRSQIRLPIGLPFLVG
jgi:hypothetical protein